MASERAPLLTGWLSKHMLVHALQAGTTNSQERRSRRRFTARCHVHDICQVLLASMRAPQPGAIYNVVDDDAASRY